jgi:hypothetical protein
MKLIFDIDKERLDNAKELEPKDAIELVFWYASGMSEMAEVASLFDGSAALVMKGSAPVMERREQFLKLFSCIRNIVKEFKEEP